MRAPKLRWRTIRGGRGNYAVQKFATKEERDEAGQKWAKLDHDNVLLECWSADHPQDDLNQGWACDDVAYAPGNEPVPDPRPVVAASQLKVGQSVSVWGFPTNNSDSGDSGFVDGVVAAISNGNAGFLSTEVHMESGEVVFCVPRSKALLNEPTETER